MISEEYYSKKIKYESQKISKKNCETTSIQDKKKPEKYQHEIYTEALSDLEPIRVPEIFKDKEFEIIKLTDKTAVDEFLFWCVTFEFSENLVKFLLSLLPDLRYKLVFVQSFVSKYSYISVILLRSKAENLASKVVHISVQLFSSELVANTAMRDFNLLEIVLSTLHNMIVTPGATSSGGDEEGAFLVISKLENASKNEHMVVDPDHSILSDNFYWLIISDLVNLLSHKQLAYEFLTNQKLIGTWFQLMTYFQVMNLSIRQFGDHVVHENPTYFSSFSAELEICSSIMWSLVQHLKSNEQIDMAKQLIKISLNQLKLWLKKIGLPKSHIKRPNFRHVSFHLPLNRYFSTLLYNSVYLQDANLETIFREIISDSIVNLNEKQVLLANLLAYPLQLQIATHEIHANMWVRNGMQMKGQAMTYVQNHFCSSFSDADLFLIQSIASQLEPEIFMNLLFERFHLKKWLEKTLLKNSNKETKLNENKSKTDQNSDISIITHIVEGMLDEFNYSRMSYSSNESSSPSQSNQNNNNEAYRDPDELEPAHEVAMLVGAFTLLAEILMIKPYMRLKTYLLTRSEIVYILSISDKSYSQVEENLPDICSLSSSKKFIQSILNQVSDYLQPDSDLFSIGSLKQGRYKLKDEIWLNEYDPLLVMQRSVKRKEYQDSFDRYVQFVEKKTAGSVTLKAKKNKLWPPFKLPDSSAYSYEFLTSLNSIKEKFAELENFDLEKELENDRKLEQNLVNRWNILNTKILHAMIIAILYEVTKLNRQ
jgi:hypothetical protein